MSSISALAGRDFLSQARNKGVSEVVQNSNASENKPSKIEHRVAQLQKETLHLAQDFLGQFAQQLFGDAAKGMQVSFDQIELNASSEASMSLSRTSDGTTSTQAANFSLSDSSSFSGRGTITTADGRQFEFELAVNYESRQELSYTQHVTRNAKPSIANDTESTPASTMHYNGTADDLLNSISAEPVRLPFKLSKPDNADQIMGDMVLKLLKLNGGDRFFDWFGNKAPAIDQTA
ncbi:hypothetical protein NT239_07175 [Chitinibacter sp. SCUT-21]|uniref:hypothetical protein n=1 Tax=Chitinibacter sp. SCUT-21 TaxID=2970891 RepID=UPI0035A63769